MGIQVQELTQNLMPWQKEFIDFSFAGRRLSDFGLVAVTSGDRYNFAGSPEFSDETTTVNGVWGQYYWGTNYKTKTYSYNLATDGMTERQFEDFKKHFKPGFYGQFYEDTWFDRYCYVRLKGTADFSFVPFQEEVEMAGVKFQSRIYKGECKISFIQDRPFMYSFYQVLNSKIEDLPYLNNDNGAAAIRMMYHSNIPAINSWTKNKKCCTGSVFSLPTPQQLKYNEEVTNIYEKESFIPYYNPSTIQTENNIEFELNRKISLVNRSKWEPVYFKEILNEFVDKNSPYNSITCSDIISSVVPLANTNFYNSSNIFKYTTPEIISETNKAINIAWNFHQENVKGALSELQKRLQEEMINDKALFWAIRVLQRIQNNYNLYTAEEIVIDEVLSAEENEEFINELDENYLGTIYFSSGDYEINKIEAENYVGCLKDNKITVYPFFLKESINVDWFGYFNIMMLMMFADHDILNADIQRPNNFTSFYPYTLKFYGKEGKATITSKINFINSNEVIEKSILDQENCSNIVYSSYLKLDGGDTLDLKTGKIASYHVLSFWEGDSVSLEVNNLKLEYNYTYV